MPCLANVIGHRGAGVLAPENTLASLRAAAVLGLRAVEFDVRLSADGVAVLMHDALLDRTTDGHGPVATAPLAALQALDAGAWFAAAFAGEPVPTLDATIDLCAALGLGINVEIKAEPGTGVHAGVVIAEQLAARWPATRLACLVSSFDTAALKAAGDVAPLLPRALIVGALPTDWRPVLTALNLTVVHCRADALSGDVTAALAAAGVTWRCYTVDDAGLAMRLLATGCAGLFTDRPDHMAGRI